MPGLRVGIVGTGGVGIASAGAIVFQGLAGCLTLYDRSGERARGEALDYLHAMPLLPSTDIRGCSFDDIQPEDVMVITVGAHTKSGQSRLDMLQGNLDVMAATAEAIERGGLPRIAIVVSSPLDVLTEYLTRRWADEPVAVMGSGTSLDTLRFTELLAQECGVHPRSVHAWVVGEHGDSSVFLFSGARIGAMSLADYAGQRKLELTPEWYAGVEEDVRSAAYRVRELTGASRHGIGLTVAGLIRCIGREAGTLIPVSVRVADGVCASLPCALGPDGPSEPLFPSMDADEAGRVGAVARRAPQGQQHPPVLTGRHADVAQCGHHPAHGFDGPRAGRVRRRTRGRVAGAHRHPLHRARPRAGWRSVLAVRERARRDGRRAAPLGGDDAQGGDGRAAPGRRQDGGACGTTPIAPGPPRCCTRSVGPSTSSAAVTSRRRTWARPPRT